MAAGPIEGAKYIVITCYKRLVFGDKYEVVALISHDMLVTQWKKFCLVRSIPSADFGVAHWLEAV